MKTCHSWYCVQWVGDDLLKMLRGRLGKVWSGVGWGLGLEGIKVLIPGNLDFSPLKACGYQP